MIASASFGCRNFTWPNPWPRRITSRLKFGVSGPQATPFDAVDAWTSGDVGNLESAALAQAIETRTRVSGRAATRLRAHRMRPPIGLKWACGRSRRVARLLATRWSWDRFGCTVTVQHHKPV